MPKHEPGSAKAIGIAIKARGLQKLRFFCSMCQKQCRDDNGFKCHLASEGHLRMMAVFMENPDEIMDEFSKSFEEAYVELLSRRFGTRRVNANYVYNEYIQDKAHIHMNATIWPTLTDFVKYLGRIGRVVVEETERGWFITYIDRNPEVLRRKEEAERLAKLEMDDAQRHEAELDALVAQARSAEGGDAASSEPLVTPLLRSEEDGARIKVALAPAAALPPATAAGAGGSADGSGGASAGDAAGAKRARPAGFDDNAFAAVVQSTAPTTTELPPASAPAPAAKRSRFGPPVTAAQPSFASTSAVASVPMPTSAPTPLALSASMSGAYASTQAAAAALLASSAAAAASVARSTFGHGVSASVPGGGGGSAPRVSGVQRVFMKELRRDLQEGGVPLAVPMVPAAPAGVAAVSAALTAPVVTAPALVAPILPVPSSDRQEAWLAVGIVVKVVNKKVADGKYYKLKGNVTAVTDDFIATVRMHDSGDVLQLDQDDCETVIPAEGGIVRVVNGAYRGHLGRVVAILTESYTTTLSLISGVYKGATVPGFEYEDVCRVTDDVASAYASA